MLEVGIIRALCALTPPGPPLLSLWRSLVFLTSVEPHSFYYIEDSNSQTTEN